MAVESVEEYLFEMKAGSLLTYSQSNIYRSGSENFPSANQMQSREWCDIPG